MSKFKPWCSIFVINAHYFPLSLFVFILKKKKLDIDRKDKVYDINKQPQIGQARKLKLPYI